MVKDELIKHGGIVILASGVSFFFGYLFHSFMGRNLGPEEYGNLEALFSIFLIILIPVSTIQAVVARYSSVYSGSNRQECIRLLMVRSFKNLFFWGFLLFFLILILSPLISDFLKISSVIPVILLGLASFLAIILPVSRGILQGVQNFNHFGLNISLEKFVLLISGIALIGFGLTGAMLSLVFSLLFVLFISFIPLRVIKGEKSGTDLKKANIINYSVPVFICLSAIAVMSNIDMLIVKHFFDPRQAGGYAIINILGKIIFLLSLNIANVIYPKASELYIQKKESVHLLKKGLFYMGIISMLIIISYTLFPGQIINFIFGEKYLNFMDLLAMYSVFMAIMAFIAIIVHYNLSTMKFFHIPSLIFCTLLEVILLVMFHDSLEQVISVLLISPTIFLILSIRRSIKLNSDNYI